MWKNARGSVVLAANASILRRKKRGLENTFKDFREKNGLLKLNTFKKTVE